LCDTHVDAGLAGEFRVREVDGEDQLIVFRDDRFRQPLSGGRSGQRDKTQQKGKSTNHLRSVLARRFASPLQYRRGSPSRRTQQFAKFAKVTRTLR
jgi:hypothetical protein